MQRDGRACADSWYWAQAIASIPSLLSYSRVRGSAGAAILTSLLVLTCIVAMLCANELISDAIHGVFRNSNGFGALPFFLAGWLDAACFGALIAALRRSHGVRLVLLSAIAFLAFVAVPIFMQVSSPLSVRTWALVLGAALSMTVGGIAYHLALLRIASRHV